MKTKVRDQKLEDLTHRFNSLKQYIKGKRQYNASKRLKAKSEPQHRGLKPNQGFKRHEGLMNKTVIEKKKR